MDHIAKKGRRFPFRPRNAEDRKAIAGKVSDIMRGVEDMLYKLARRRVQGLMDEHEVQEIVQGAMIWLWERSLPKYDAWRRPAVKVSTFLYRCAANFINQEVRAIMRRRNSRRRVLLVDPDLMMQTLHSTQSPLDDKIAAVAQDVLDHPEKYLTVSQVQVFKTITANPHTMMKDLARELGYQRASSLSMMLRRIRERILEIDVEDYEPAAAA